MSYVYTLFKQIGRPSPALAWRGWGDGLDARTIGNRGKGAQWYTKGTVGFGGLARGLVFFYEPRGGAVWKVVCFVPSRLGW